MERTGCHSLVVIDVELGIWVNSTSCFESDPHVVFTDNPLEDTVTKGTILVENFIQNVLGSISNVAL
jgi:hypothetical protein